MPPYLHSTSLESPRKAGRAESPGAGAPDGPVGWLRRPRFSGPGRPPAEGAAPTGPRPPLRGRGRRRVAQAPARGPVFVGANAGRRRRSSSERPWPSGTTTSSASSLSTTSGRAARARRHHSRLVARSRTLPTVRTRTCSPGSSIRSASILRWAARSSAVGPRSSDQDLSVEPAQQRDVAGLAREFGVPVAAADLGGVLPAHRQLAVAHEHAGIGDVELAGEGSNDRSGDRRRVGQERF